MGPARGVARIKSLALVFGRIFRRCQDLGMDGPAFDDLVSEQTREKVLAAVKDAGIRDIKVQSHDGGHGIHSPHFTEALDWFLETR